MVLAATRCFAPSTDRHGSGSALRRGRRSGWPVQAPVRRTRPARAQEAGVRAMEGRAGSGVVVARIDRDQAASWSVRVRGHEQTPAKFAELAEHVEAVLAEEAGSAAGVRLGRCLAATLTPEDAKESDRSWLEGCIWSAARASGLAWDRWRCAAVAEALRTQREGWGAGRRGGGGGAGSDPAGEVAGCLRGVGGARHARTTPRYGSSHWAAP